MKTLVQLGIFGWLGTYGTEASSWADRLFPKAQRSENEALPESTTTTATPAEVTGDIPLPRVRRYPPLKMDRPWASLFGSPIVSEPKTSSSDPVVIDEPETEHLSADVTNLSLNDPDMEVKEESNDEDVVDNQQEHGGSDLASQSSTDRESPIVEDQIDPIATDDNRRIVDATPMSSDLETGKTDKESVDFEFSSINSVNSEAEEQRTHVLQFGSFLPMTFDDSTALRRYGPLAESVCPPLKRWRLQGVPGDSNLEVLDDYWRDTHKCIEAITWEINVEDDSDSNHPLASAIQVGSTQSTPLGSLLLAQLIPENAYRPCGREEYIASDKSRKRLLLVKYGDLNTDYRIKNEYTVLQFLEEINIAPKPLYLSKPAQGFVLEARFIVTEYVGPTLFFAGPMMTRDQKLDAAIQSLEALEIIHRTGIVHGDISEFSIRYCPVRRKIYLTDFEHASFYPEHDEVARNQKLRLLHVPTHPSCNPPKQETYLASPWELQGGTYTRRDDLYRWAESFARVLGGDEFRTWFQSAVADPKAHLLQFKRRAQLFMLHRNKHASYWADCDSAMRFELHAKFAAILSHIRSLEPEQKPDYHLIKESLSSVRRTLSYCSI